jgi:hypothetical protein
MKLRKTFGFGSPFPSLRKAKPMKQSTAQVSDCFR